MKLFNVHLECYEGKHSNDKLEFRLVVRAPDEEQANDDAIAAVRMLLDLPSQITTVTQERIYADRSE